MLGLQGDGFYRGVRGGRFESGEHGDLWVRGRVLGLGVVSSSIHLIIDPPMHPNERRLVRRWGLGRGNAPVRGRARFRSLSLPLSLEYAPPNNRLRCVATAETAVKCQEACDGMMGCIGVIFKEEDPSECIILEYKAACAAGEDEVEHYDIHLKPESWQEKVEKSECTDTRATDWNECADAGFEKVSLLPRLGRIRDLLSLFSK